MPGASVQQDGQGNKREWLSLVVCDTHSCEYVEVLQIMFWYFITMFRDGGI